MSRKLTALALFTAAACVGANAQAADVTGWFVNGGVGSAHYHASYEGYDLQQTGSHIPRTSCWSVET